ncbi:MAG TPA: TadE family protein [Candidatus Dormibacteraeota bacterium]|jgi:hypothetical protein|nr:TadE family protein [Candidatus Dormibacteraeota bacterium]
MGRRGQAMVETALAAPLLLLLVFGLYDFSRLIQANTTVAEAAREGARQAAANQDSADSPFGTADSNPCPGTNLTTSANGHGCLTDARIQETVAAILAAGGLGRNPTLNPNGARDAASCRLSANLPTPGFASVCVNPAQSGTAGGYASCAAAKTALGHDPGPSDLGTRNEEWLAPKYRGCYLVQVTVIYAYQPFTGLLQSVVGNRLQVISTSATLTEY